jgi:site-specific DNA recombinase
VKGKTSRRNIQRVSGPKRAGILIRVSSAEQAVKKNKDTGETEFKFSPEVQEKDCREHCKQRGHVVAAVYYDIDKYRDAHGRLVEPSGTRSDRPGLKQALVDIDAGKIDVLVGWRQDRLVRGITRALIELKERITEGKVEIELAKEQFNVATFEVLAWAAGVELQAKHDRLMMGITARLAKGKAWNMRDPLGYKVIDGKFTVVPDEAKWVNLIWKWYAGGVTSWVIRKRLIAGGAPQRAEKHRNPWRIDYIRRLLRYEPYYTGVFKAHSNGEVFEIPIPTIVDAETARRVQEQHKKYKAYPAGNLKVVALVAGLIYCKACNVRMGASNSASKKAGYKHWYSYYVCNNRHYGLCQPQCPHSVRTNRIDAEVWEKVWNLISQPDRFKRAIDERIAQLQARQMDAEAEGAKLQRQLEDVLAKRQSVINWALEGKITEADMELQLKILDTQHEELERDLSEQRLLADHRVERLKELAELYREQVQAGAQDINMQPETPEEQRLYFEWQRKIVQRLVTRVDVLEDKSTQVHTELDFMVLQVTSNTANSPPTTERLERSTSRRATAHYR